MTDRRCADCIHFAPWPERAERYGHGAEYAPFFPLHACMADGCSVIAVSPSFSPDGRGSIAFGCQSFERGSRKERYREV